MTPKDTTPVETQVEYVCIGRRMADGDKLVYAWQTPEQIANGDVRFSAWTKIGEREGAYTGARFLFTRVDDSVYISGSKGPKQIGTWSNKDQINEWATLGRAAAAEKEEKNEIKKLQGIDYLVKLLAPITRAYAKANKNQRAAILGVVISIITSGKVE